MKAFALTAADQPATLTDLPDPADSFPVVRVRAASVNGFDVYQAGGALMGMMPHELPTTIGRDFAGTIESADGSGTFKVADEVLGFIPSAPPLHDGSWAELVGGNGVVLASKPSGIDFETAAALPLAGATALDALEAVQVGSGDIVVIAGATGGVGSIAVQLAAQRGARVIATARAGDEDRLVRELGASETVDYSSGDVVSAIRALAPEGITALIDTVNRDAGFAAMADVVRNGGRLATTLGAADVEGLAARGVRATNIMAAPTPEKLSALAEAVAAGTLRVEIQRTFPLAEANDAIAAYAAGTLGKLVLTVD